MTIILTLKHKVYGTDSSILHLSPLFISKMFQNGEKDTSPYTPLPGVPPYLRQQV